MWFLSPSVSNLIKDLSAGRVFICGSYPPPSQISLKTFLMPLMLQAHAPHFNPHSTMYVFPFGGGF